MTFLESLRLVVEELTPEEDDNDTLIDEDVEFLHEKLSGIASACDEYDEEAATALLAELKEKSWSKPTKELLDKISEFIFISDFEGIVDVVNEYLE